MIRRPPRSTLDRSSAASDVYKRQDELFFPKKKVRTIQLERRGKVYTMRVANAGEPLQSSGSVTLDNIGDNPVSYTHLRAHETVLDIVCRLLLKKTKNKQKKTHNTTNLNTQIHKHKITA